MSDLELVFSVWDIFQNKFSIFIRFREVRRLRDDDVCRHFKMYIAEHCPHAGFIEDVVSRCVLCICSQIETRRPRREHIVPDLIAIRKSDSCANEHRQDMRHKLEVYLIENDRAGWSGVSLPRYLIDVDNRIAVVTCGLDEDLAVDGGGHSQGRRI